MASSASSARVTKALYRGLLRAGARLPATPAVLAAFTLPAGLPDAAPNLAAVIRHQFKTIRQPDVDAGLRALATANTLANARQAAPASDECLPVPAIRPGTVFRHRLYGYRAVVVACDDACRASEQWIQSTGANALPRGTAQPFYHCLVDIRDRPEAQVSYVAQDNVQLMAPDEQGAGVERLVLHPLLTRHFAAYRTDMASYVPHARELEDGAGPVAAAGGGVPRVSSVAE